MINQVEPSKSSYQGHVLPRDKKEIYKDNCFFQSFNFLIDDQLKKCRKIAKNLSQIKEIKLQLISHNKGQVHSLSPIYFTDLLTSSLFNALFYCQGYTVKWKLEMILSFREEQLQKKYFSLAKSHLHLEKILNPESIKEFPEKLSRAEMPEEKIRKIFELENYFRKYLRQNLFKKTYWECIIPMVRGVKKFLRERPFSYVSHAAASKGNGASRLFETLVNLSAENRIVCKNITSRHNVILLPLNNLVLKKLKGRAKEEESIFSSLCDFYSKNAVVGSFSCKLPQANRFSIPVFHDLIEEKHALDLDRQPKLMNAIINQLSHTDRLLVQAKNTLLTSHDEKIFDRYSKKVYRIQPDPYSDFQPISFKQLKLFYLTYGPSFAYQVGFDKKNGHVECSFSELKEREPALYKFLNKYTLSPLFPLTVTPELKSEKDRAAYESCSRWKWNYQKDNGHIRTSSFKELHKNYLLGKKYFHVCPVGQVSWDTTHLDRALNVKWKLVRNELLELRNSYKIKRLIDYEAKPFIQGMVKLNQLRNYPDALHKIFKRLTAESEFNGILTGLLQCLDLHSANLAVAPIPNAAFQKFQHYQMYLPFDDLVLNFSQFLLSYLNEEIEDSDCVRYFSDNQWKKGKICSDADLLEAVNIDWKLVIFDTDLSLGEDNELQVQVLLEECPTQEENNELQMQESEEHLIPLRSALLELAWKDEPLKPETIEMLKRSEKSDFLAANWIRRLEASMRKKLPTECLKRFDNLWIKNKSHSLSCFRRTLKDCTMSELRDFYVENLCDISQNTLLQEWTRIQQEMLSKNKGKFTVELTSATEESKKQREKIVKALFPRLSIRQQTALFDRTKAMRNYLKKFDEINTYRAEENQLFDKIRIYLNDKETPLNSIEKARFLTILEAAQKSMNFREELESLRQNICQKCQPTYFNLMKAMYPLLADAFELYRLSVDEIKYFKDFEIFENAEQLAGECIGHYRTSLENAIELVKNKFQKGDLRYLLAVKMEKAIQNKKDPSFFGYWLSRPPT